MYFFCHVSLILHLRFCTLFFQYNISNKSNNNHVLQVRKIRSEGNEAEKDSNICHSEMCADREVTQNEL